MIRRTLKSRIALLFFVILLILLVSNLYSLATALWLRRQFEGMYSQEMRLGRMDSRLERVRSDLKVFVLTGGAEERDILQAALEGLEDTVPVKRPVSRNQRFLMERTIYYLIDRYILQVEGVVEARSRRDYVGYSETYRVTEKTFGMIEDYREKILLDNLEIRSDQYLEAARIYRDLQLNNLIVLGLAVLLLILLILRFIHHLAEPVELMSRRVREIGRGNFDVPDIPESNQLEISVMARGFNEMKRSLKNSITEIREKAEVERSLADQKIRNMEMEHLLKNAEMASLRSHMNPHFLFNSLNTGVQLATMEDADRTAEYMDKLARLFRHNVKSLDQSHHLRDEAEGLDLYSELLRERFGDKYTITVQLPPALGACPFPPMILQPLVENSVLHGFADREDRDCRVAVRGEISGLDWLLRVEDNGWGIGREAREKALAPLNPAGDFPRRSRGIGLRNVVLRMRLFYDREDAVSIGTSLEGGAAVILRIPQGGIPQGEQNGQRD